MSMITELVRELRRAENPCDLVGVGYYRTLYARAADTIEELSAKLAAANMERSTDYYNDGWIPVAERLPERNDFYDVTFELDCGVRLCQCEYFDIEDNRWLTPYNVIAWKERPEPYKGVE